MVNWHCIEYYSTFHERNGNTYFGEFHSFERSRFGFDQFSIQFEGGSGREKGDERYLVEVSSPVSCNIEKTNKYSLFIVKVRKPTPPNYKL